MHSGIFTYKGTCTRAGELMVKRPEQKAEKSKKKSTAAAATTRRAKAAKAKKAAAASSSRSSSGSNIKSNSNNPPVRAKARLAAARTKENASASPSSGYGKKTSHDNTENLEGASPSPPPPSPPLGRSCGAAAQGVLGAGDPAAGAGGAVGTGRNFRESSHDALQQVEEEDAEGTTAEDDDEASDEPEREPPTFKQVIAGAVEEGLEVYEKGARLRILAGILLNVPWVVVLYFIGGGKVVYQSD